MVSVAVAAVVVVVVVVVVDLALVDRILDVDTVRKPVAVELYAVESLVVAIQCRIIPAVDEEANERISERLDKAPDSDPF
jgi:hypothetical protein